MQPTSKLTPTEERIYKLLLTKDSSEEIAIKLNRKVTHVYNSTKKIYIKKGTTDRYGLMAKEIQRCYAIMATAQTER